METDLDPIITLKNIENEIKKITDFMRNHENKEILTTLKNYQEEIERIKIKLFEKNKIDHCPFYFFKYNANQN